MYSRKTVCGLKHGCDRKIISVKYSVGKSASMNASDIIPSEIIEKRIFLIRGQKVMLDVHLAELYQVETKALKRTVKRNKDHFPEDFCFELTQQEYTALRY
jgi:hypothetical protein